MDSNRSNSFKIRFAEERDVPVILGFIKELAVYEHLLDQVTATEEVLRQSLFECKAAEVIIAEYENKPVGYSLFFYSFSTFLGRPGIYLEDLYITPEMRGKGFGKTMLSFMAKIAVERNCVRFEWSCLDWNEPSIQLYKKLGAVSLDEWTMYRLIGKPLENLARNYNEKSN